ncbi:MAG: CotH kinase family protein [Atopobiaceae bacterium]|nr:CotH kinase family protein [Atopobiaceae bacterium]
MGTIFDRTAAHIQRNALVIVATLLLAISTVSSTAFAESALSDSADAASDCFERPIGLDDNYTVSDSASSDLEQRTDDGNCPASPEDTDSLGPSEKPPVLSAQDEYQSGSIPVLRLTFHDDVDPETGEVTLSGDEKIDLMNGAENHSYRAEGVTMDLEVPPAYDNPEDDLWDGVSGYGGEANLALEFIRGRGNSTWRAAKKPYKFKLGKDANLFGMGKNKHWTLIANYYDTSLTINRLVAWLGDQMGLSYTPRGVPVDLYMNDAYYGSYLLMEEVRVDSSRVDIDVVDEEAADLDSLDITGGYLIGMARKPLAQSYEYCTTKRTNDYSYDTPEYGAELTEAEQAQQTYLLSYLECIEDAIYSKGLTSPSGDNLWDLMDQASAADYWWIQEFTGNRDAFATPSTYLYKLRDTLNADGTVTTGKLYWGPLWDFDFVWGEFYAESFDNANASWIARLRQDPAFVELLKRRWEVLDGILEQVTTEGGLLDRYLAEMAQSWEGNHQRWPKEETTDWSGGSYAEAIEELRAHIDARRAWINANLDQLPTAYHTITFMDGDTEVLSGTFRQGEPPTIEPPQMDEREGLLWLGWLLPNGEEYNPYKEYSEDITVCATYVDPSTVIAVQDIFFSFPEIWMSNVSLIRYDLKPANAVDTRIVWTSSDESVVTVDEEGIAWAVEGCLDGAQTASATITATLVGSGKSASFRVVVYDPNSIQLPKPDSIQFESPVTLEVGAYQQVSIASTPYPNDLYEYNYLRFEIEDDEIAEVSDWGVVTAKRPGTTSLIVRRTNPETYEPEVVGTVTVTVTESAPEPTPKPEPTPEPATSADAVPAPSPASQASPSSKQVKATTSTASGKAVLPKTGDTAAPFAGAACLAAAAGVCLLLARRLRR